MRLDQSWHYHMLDVKSVETALLDHHFCRALLL